MTSASGSTPSSRARSTNTAAATPARTSLTLSLIRTTSTSRTSPQSLDRCTIRISNTRRLGDTLSLSFFALITLFLFVFLFSSSFLGPLPRARRLDVVLVAAGVAEADAFLCVVVAFRGRFGLVTVVGDVNSPE